MSTAKRERSRSPIDENRKRSRSRSPRSHRKINSKRCIISNIPYDLKWQEIKDLFRNEVGDVVYVELFSTPDGKPKGSGVVEFRDVETAAQAIDKMHRYEVKDRKLVVREERDRDRREYEMMQRGGGGHGGGPGGGMDGRDGGRGVMGPAPRNMGMGGGAGGSSAGISPQILQQLGIEGPLSCTVFVSNLDYKVSWRKLKDVFRLAGNVTRAEIMEDNEGKSRGMGTVTFETPVEAVQAISMFNNQSLFDRRMRVKLDGQSSSSGPKAEPLPSGLKSLGPSLTNLQQMSSMDMGMGMGAPSMGGGMGGMGTGSMGMGSTGMPGMGAMTGMGSGMGAGMGTTGMGSGMGNMGSVMGNMGTGSMSGMGSMGTGMGSMAGGTGLGMGMGDSGYSGAMSGMGSSAMGTTGMTDSFGMSSMGSGMGTSSGFSSMMDSSRSSSMGSYGSQGMSSRMDYGRDSGRSNTSSLPSGDMRTRADKSTVIVKNLPYSVDWQTLKSKFQSVGDIRFAEISKNDKGKSNGWGLVSFRREEDAQTAVQKMNRANIEGRGIVVKLLS